MFGKKKADATPDFFPPVSQKDVEKEFKKYVKENKDHIIYVDSSADDAKLQKIFQKRKHPDMVKEIIVMPKVTAKKLDVSLFPNLRILNFQEGPVEQVVGAHSESLERFKSGRSALRKCPDEVLDAPNLKQIDLDQEHCKIDDEVIAKLHALKDRGCKIRLFLARKDLEALLKQNGRQMLHETLDEYLARTRPGSPAVTEEPAAANSNESGGWANFEQAASAHKPVPPSNVPTPTFDDNWANFDLAPTTASQATASANSNADQATIVPAQENWAAFDFDKGNKSDAVTDQKSDPFVAAKQSVPTVVGKPQPKNPFDELDEAEVAKYAQTKPAIDPFAALMAPNSSASAQYEQQQQVLSKKSPAFDPFAALAKK